MSKDVSLGLVLVGMLTASVAMGFTTPQRTTEFGLTKSNPIGMRVLRPDLAAASAEQFRGLKGKGKLIIEADRLTGAARVISGGTLLEAPTLEARSGADAFIDQAMLYVNENGDTLGVDARDLTLVKNAVLIDKHDQFFKFAVSRDGLTILDAGLDFRFKHGRLIQVANQTFAEAGADGRASLGGLDRIAQEAIAATDVVAKGEAYRVVATKDGYDLVRVALFDATSMGGEAYEIQIVAATGDVFQVSPKSFHLNGSARGEVHQRWYNEPTTQLTYGGLTLPHASGTVTTGLNGTFSDAPNGSAPKIDGFIGPLVKVNLVSGTKVVRDGSQVRDEWHVVYNRQGAEPVDNDKYMAQSMVFFHTNHIIQQAKQYVQSPWFDRQLTANVNLTQTCNAHWDGTTINFYSGGGGCANTALISDVVFHEWGHGLDHNSGGIADGGFSEGFGDIMSMINTESNVLGIGFRTNGAPVRDLEPDRIYPQDAGGGVHQEGLIIGGTFWDLFKALRDTHGREAALELVRKYAFKMIFTATRYTDVYNAVLVIDDDNGDLTDETPNFCTLNAVFAAHGLATVAESCQLAGVDDVDVDDSNGGNGNGILEPGESADLYFTARNASANAIDSLTGVLTVNNASVSVTDANVEWGAIPARSPRRSDDAATVAIAANAQCGSRFDAALALSGNGRSVTVTRSLVLGELVMGSAEGFNAAGLPLPINDNQTTAVPVSVSGGQWDATAEVQAARLAFDITHTYAGDLTVNLIAPNGTSYQVFRGSGSDDNVAFDQDITELVRGVRGAGNWRVDVIDSAAQDVGSVTRVALNLTPGRFQCD
jgi:subtilisin-like proprotein convertase family protein